VNHPETCLSTSPIWPHFAFDKYVNNAIEEWADTDSICVYFNIISNVTDVEGPDPVENDLDAREWHDQAVGATTWEVVIVDDLAGDYIQAAGVTFPTLPDGGNVVYTKLTIVKSDQTNDTIAHEYGHTWDSTQSHQSIEEYIWPETANVYHYGEDPDWPGVPRAMAYPQRNYNWNLMTYDLTGGLDADMEFKINKFPYNDWPYPCYRWCENF